MGKRRWRARTPRRFALQGAADLPAGLGVRARQRRFPTHARRFNFEPVHQAHNEGKMMHIEDLRRLIQRYAKYELKLWHHALTG